MNNRLFRTIAIVMLAVIGIATVYWAYITFLAPVPEDQDAGQSTPQPVDTGIGVVSAEAQVVPFRRSHLTFEAGGRVSEVLVAAGDTVTAGDPLLRLDATELEVALSEADAAVAMAEAGVLTAEAQVAAAQVNVEAARKGVEAANAQLALALAEPRPEEISVLEGRIAAADALIGQAAAQRDVAVTGATTAQIEAAEAQLAAAQAQEDILRVQYNQLIFINQIGGTEEEQLRAQLQAAEVATEAAQAALDELLAGTTSTQQRAANSGVGVSVAQRDAVRAELDLLLADPRPEELDVLAINVALAEVETTRAEMAVELAEAAVTQAEAAVQQVQAGRDTVAAALARMTLYAPYSGTISEILVDVGDIVTPAFPSLRMADLSAWVVETTDLTELDVVAVGEGDAVDVRVDAIPDQVLSGVVTKIAQVADETRGTVTYAVTIGLEDVEDYPLRWGMTAFVDIDVDR